jgi:hypothetical protein
MKKAKATAAPEIQEKPVTARIIPLRTETTLTRYPIHRLAKKGSIKISQTQRDDRGQVLSTWQVKHPPGPLAYKVDTLVINRRIEEFRPNVPSLIKLGSLRDICLELGLTDCGKNKNGIREALHENASAYIRAKLDYRGKDRAERQFEFGSTRYGVILTGEKLPDGQTADAVYIVLHELFLSLLHYSDTRPLDYEYLRSLPPAAQRIYELISFSIYGALKHERRDKEASASVLYSDICQRAPLTRYFEYERVKKQMWKIHLPHRKSGYLKAVNFEETTDAENRTDWLIIYTPGDKARAEFLEFQEKPRERVSSTRPIQPRLIEAPGGGDELAPLVARLTAEGISEVKARELAAKHREAAERELESFPHRERSKMKEPAAWLIRAIEKGNYSQPSDIEQKRKRAGERERTAKTEAEKKAREEHREKFIDRYHDYLRPERDRIERERPDEYKRYADFIAGNRVLRTISEIHQERTALGFFEDFIEERPELGVLTFWQWDKERNSEAFEDVPRS